MKYKVFACLLLILLLIPPLCFAAGELSFPDKSVTMYEGEQMQAPLVIQEGLEGEVSYTSTNRKVAYVDENGMLIAVSKGQVTISAAMKAEKRTYVAKLKVNVLRPVTGMKLNERGLNLLTAEDGPAFNHVKNLIANDLYETLPEEELEAIHRVLLLKKGASLALKVTMEPSGASDRSFTVFAAQTDILRVSKTTIKGLAPGAAMLQLTSTSNPSVSILLPVLVVEPVTKVRVSAEKTTLTLGEQAQTILTFTPEDATLQAVSYSSDNEKIATVDEKGLVTAHAKGQTAIRVMTMDGTKRVSYVNIQVVQLPEAVTIEETAPLILNVGDTHGLKAVITPDSASDKKVLWTSSDESVAQVNASGQVTATGQGQCEILCVSQAREQVRTTLPVIVVQLARNLSFVSEKATLLAGQRALLRYVLEPLDVTNGEVAFTSSNEAVASVNENGIVTALSDGTASITVAAQDGSGKKDSLELTVARKPEKVTIHQQGPLTLATGRKTQVTAEVWPQDSENRKIAWASTDETVATVSVEGIISGKTAGECDIVAVSQSAPEVMDVIHLIVRQRLKSVRFASGKESVRAGESISTQVILEPADVPPTELIYSSRDEGIAQVDQNGVVTGVAPGRTIIRAQAQDGSGRYGQMTVTVLEAPKSLTLDADSLTLSVGQSHQIGVTGVSQTLWESTSGQIATVDENGVVTAVSTGRCVVTCTAQAQPDLKASVTVRVVQQVTDIQVSPESLSLEAGQQGKISWTVFPGDADDPTVIMESTDPAVAQVDQKGMVTALQAGACEIVLSAADGMGQTARVSVTVTEPEPDIRVQLISLSNENGQTALTLRSDGDTELAGLELQAECFNIFGEALPCGADGKHTQAVICAGALLPGEAKTLSALTWEKSPDQLKGLGRIVLQVKKACLTDGRVVRLSPDAAGPALEILYPGYIGYVPTFQEATMPVKDE